MKISNLLVLIFALGSFLSLSQKPNHAGFSYFSKYNSNLISSETSMKHVFSLGLGVTEFTSKLNEPSTRIIRGNRDNQVLSYRVGLGYHYLFLKNKKLTVFSKSRFEFSGFSVYANIYGNNLQAGTYTQTESVLDSFNILKSRRDIPQIEVRFTYTNPFISYRGKVFNFYFLHEFGLSIMRGTTNTITKPNDKNISTLVNIIPLSLKFGKRPIFFKSSINFALNSKLLQKEKIKGSIGLEMQIYLYKTKNK